MSNYILIILCVLCLCLGQIGMKYFSVNFTYEGNIYSSIQHNLPYIAILILSLVTYVGSTALWIVVLRDFPLSRAYIFVSLGFIIGPCMAYFLFDEQLTTGFFIGTALVMAGVYISTL